MAKRERISSVDTAWLRMDRPNNLMMIVGVMMFDGPVDFERLKGVVDRRFCKYRRFRQKAVVEATGAYWEDDADFDLDAHVKRTALAGAGGKTELQKLVADLATTPLDPGRPLWQFLLVEHYDGGAALVARIHHSIADGIALIGVLLAMTDESPEAGDAEVTGGHAPAEAADEPDFWRRLYAPLTEAALATLKLSGTLWSKYLELLSHPQQAWDYARLGGAVAAELAALALMPDDTRTRFKGTPGRVKCVAWSEPMPLDEVKAVGKSLGCSVNDVLLSCVAGALRDYLGAQGDAVEGVELRALVPVNLRTHEHENQLGNRFGLVALVLPVGVENPLERLYEVKRRMEALKGSHQAVVTLGLLGAVGLCPKPVQDQILDILAAKATAVMTNVPGPQAPLYLAGARLAQQMFWVPQSGDVGVGVSILSYNGAVQFGLICDRKFVPDPERIVACFQPEFEKILYSVLLEPWGGEAAEAAPPAKPAAKRRRTSGRKQSATPDAPAAAAQAPETPDPPAAPAAPRVPRRFR